MEKFQGCPGSKMMDFNEEETTVSRAGEAVHMESQLRQWPIQMHLISPTAPYFIKKDVLLTADCVPFALANFHTTYLKGKSIAIACPKLDDGQDIYVEKIKSLFEDAQINTLTVIIMQVPCCSGLVRITKQALDSSERKAPVKTIVVSLQGEILSEEWM